MARKNNILKEKKKLGVKFYSILSSIIAVLIIGGIILLVCLYNHFNTDTYRNRFGDWTEHKINYDELTDILEDPNTSNHIFIFLYDETYFDQTLIDELDDDNPTKSTFIRNNEALNAFYAAIEANQEKYESSEANIYDRVEFYIINTSLQGNNGILSDDKYGAPSQAPALIYLYGEECKTMDETEEYTLSGGNGNYTTLIQVLRDARDFVTSKTGTN